MPDVPEPLARIVDHGSYKGPAHPLDVICFIKKHMCDYELAQRPLLVLSHTRAQSFVLVPTTKLLGFPSISVLEEGSSFKAIGSCCLYVAEGAQQPHCHQRL